jgi:hypothetical protein
MAENTVSFTYKNAKSEIFIRKSAVGCLQNHFEPNKSREKKTTFIDPRLP